MWCSGTHSTHDSTTGTACRRHGPRHEQTAKQTQIDRSVADATPTMLQAVAAHLSSASSRLSPHLVSKPASGNTLLPERNAALADSELQRQRELGTNRDNTTTALSRIHPVCTLQPHSLRVLHSHRTLSTPDRDWHQQTIT